MHWEMNLFNFVPLLFDEGKWFGNGLVEDLEGPLSGLFRG